MKLATVKTGELEAWGAVEASMDGSGVFVPAAPSLLSEWPTLSRFLGAESMETLASGLDRGRSISLAEAVLLPPIPRPKKILCVGLNYAAHVEEMGRARAGHPTLFTRFADAQAGHDAPIVKPRHSGMFDYEGELAVIIGKPCHYASVETALSHVAGYACFQDGSARDWQRHTSQFTPGKNFPASGAFGPWIVTADEILDPQALSLKTRLNGVTVQDGHTSEMIFPVAEVIAYISAFTPLHPGDVIATGTPPGVGFARDPQLFLKPGDVVEVEIEKIGVLRNRVVAG